MQKRDDGLKMDSRILRFAATGLMATTLHVVISLSLISANYVSSALANAIAFALTTTISYFVNTRWSFSQRITISNSWRYFLVSFIGLVLSYNIADFAEKLTHSPLLSIFFVILFVPPIIFLLHKKFTYREAI